MLSKKINIKSRANDDKEVKKDKVSRKVDLAIRWGKYNFVVVDKERSIGKGRRRPLEALHLLTMIISTGGQVCLHQTRIIRRPDLIQVIGLGQDDAVDGGAFGL